MPFPAIPEEIGALPDCATDYLYSIGDVHYYQTVDCSNPILTGYGTTSPNQISPQGCDGSVCTSGSTVTPVISSLAGFTRSVGLNDLSDSLGGLGNKNPLRIKYPKTKAGAKAFRKLLKDLKDRDDVDETRGDLARDLRGSTAETRNLVNALNGELGKAMKAKAEYYVSRMEKRISMAVVSTDQDRNFFIEDRDHKIDLLATTNDDGTEIDISNIASTADTTNIEDIDAITVDDASVTGFIDGNWITSKYIQIEELEDSPIFRLQTVSITRGAEVEESCVGQQVDDEELPTDPGPPDIIVGDTNIKVVDRHSHYHVLQVRTTQDDPDEITVDNSKMFIVYSAVNLSSVSLP